MKNFWILLILLTTSSALLSQSFEIVDGDTLNRRDVNKRKQGKWVVKAKANKNPNYKLGQIVEEGRYQNSRKVGLWKAYFPNGKLKSEITYKNGRPMGAYVLYFENGKIEEKGNWQRTKNTGDFERYHPNGQLAQKFKFTEDGTESKNITTPTVN